MKPQWLNSACFFTQQSTQTHVVIDISYWAQLSWSSKAAFFYPIFFHKMKSMYFPVCNSGTTMPGRLLLSSLSANAWFFILTILTINHNAMMKSLSFYRSTKVKEKSASANKKHPESNNWFYFKRNWHGKGKLYQHSLQDSKWIRSILWINGYSY